jgi:membrane-bound lytic murein transglycosylase D
VRRNRERGLDPDFWNLDLPEHTQEYVLKLLALRDIVATPGHYGIDLPQPDATTQIALIETSSRMDLGQAAHMAGISLADVQKLNPGLRKTSTPPQGPHRLVVPLAVADRFAAHLADLSDDNAAPKTTVAQNSSAELATVTPVNTATVTTHRVRSGETLWSLARHYGLSVAELAERNGLGQGTALRAGQTLHVAGGKQGTRAAADTVVAAAPSDTPGDRQTMKYTVKRGDSLIQISRRYRVTIGDLRKWNGLHADDHLQPGQKLTLYLDTSLRADGSGG